MVTLRGAGLHFVEWCLKKYSMLCAYARVHSLDKQTLPSHVLHNHAHATVTEKDAAPPRAIGGYPFRHVPWVAMDHVLCAGIVFTFDI